MANVYFSQTRTIDPFEAFNSNIASRLTEMMTEGLNCILTPDDYAVTLNDATSYTDILISPGRIFKDDLIIECTASKTVDIRDRDYYRSGSTFGANGTYYLCIDYTYVKTKPAHSARIRILTPAEHALYPGTAYVFLKAITVNAGNITGLYDYDPGTPTNRRVYCPIWQEIIDINLAIDQIYVDMTNALDLVAVTTRDQLDLDNSATSIDLSSRPGLVELEEPTIIETFGDGNEGIEFSIIYNEDISYPALDQTYAVNTNLTSGVYRYRDITINAGVTVTCQSDTSTTYGKGVVIFCRNLTIPATAMLSANNQGFTGAGAYTYTDGNGPGAGQGGDGSEGGGGAGHGGSGGDGGGAGTNIGGRSYGSNQVALCLGSGGASSDGYGGNGGGAIYIYASGTINVDGTLVASGQAGQTKGGTDEAGGGGSGGSIELVCSVLTGSGSIAADGGDGGDHGTGGQGGGGGGGGRLYIYTDSYGFTSVPTVSGGDGGTGVLGQNGEDGEDGDFKVEKVACYSSANVVISSTFYAIKTGIKARKLSDGTFDVIDVTWDDIKNCMESNIPATNNINTVIDDTSLDQQAFIAFSFDGGTPNACPSITEKIEGTWSETTPVATSNSYGNDVAVKDGYIHYVYTNLGSGELRYFYRKDGVNSDIEIIADFAGYPTGYVMSPRIRIDNAGFVHVVYAEVSYSAPTYTYSKIWYATNKRGLWENTTVQTITKTSSTHRAWYVDLAIDIDNIPHITYLDNAANVKYATHTINLETWSTTTVVAGGYPVWSSHCPSIAVDHYKKVHIIWLPTNGTIYHATNFTGAWVVNNLVWITDATYYIPTPGNDDIYFPIVCDKEGFCHTVFSIEDVGVSQRVVYCTNRSITANATFPTLLEWEKTYITSPVTGPPEHYALTKDAEDNIYFCYVDNFNYILKYYTNKTGSWVLENAYSPGTFLFELYRFGMDIGNLLSLGDTQSGLYKIENISYDLNIDDIPGTNGDEVTILNSYEDVPDYISETLPAGQIYICNSMIDCGFSGGSGLGANGVTVVYCNNYIINTGQTVDLTAAGWDYNDGWGLGHYGAGGGHGGAGGPSGVPGSLAGPTYGLNTCPIYPGSGGQRYTGSGTRGEGGGALIIIASNEVKINGTLNSNGYPGFSYCLGGGSGGSIYIKCRKFSGSGVINAYGGAGYSSANPYGSGGGGGGRIAIEYCLTSWTGTYNVNGGALGTGVTANGFAGAAGTWSYVITNGCSPTLASKKNVIIENDSTKIRLMNDRALTIPTGGSVRLRNYEGIWQEIGRNCGVSQLYVDTGYARLDNGLMIAWGEQGIPVDFAELWSYTLYYPVTFNKVLSISAWSRYCGGNMNSNNVHPADIYNDRCKFFTGEGWPAPAQSLRINYMIIGY